MAIDVRNKTKRVNSIGKTKKLTKKIEAARISFKKLKSDTREALGQFLDIILSNFFRCNHARLV